MFIVKLFWDSRNIDTIEGNIGMYLMKFCLFLTVDIEQDGFSQNPFFHAIIAEVPEQHKTKDGEKYTM